MSKWTSETALWDRSVCWPRECIETGPHHKGDISMQQSPTSFAPWFLNTSPQNVSWGNFRKIEFPVTISWRFWSSTSGLGSRIHIFQKLFWTEQIILAKIEQVTTTSSAYSAGAQILSRAFTNSLPLLWSWSLFYQANRRTGVRGYLIRKPCCRLFISWIALLSYIFLMPTGVWPKRIDNYSGCYQQPHPFGDPFIKWNRPSFFFPFRILPVNRIISKLLAFKEEFRQRCPELSLLLALGAHGIHALAN